MTTLHYLFDPLCGWCYAAAPLVAAARDVPGLTIALHGGGMMTGPNRRTITPQWREHVMPHDRRIAQLSGQPFGSGYFDGLLNDTTAVTDSAPPTTAILAAEQVGGRGLDLLHRLQRAHYVDGLRIADTDLLLALAADIGPDAAAFEAAFTDLLGARTDAHFAESRALLVEVGGQGFPTFALADAEGSRTRIDASRFLGQPDAWIAHLTQSISNLAASRSTP
ncbi:DsbA family protein [Variovorax sp. PAMC 28711]|uniref:DsbA family protein n=1 Tax=Variovorax sp. PAMC 28711 TaxID=1795631 RepID=UPI0009EB6017|nr:DsbA family protein [Variovorax sp. PAMC 28711]